MAQYLKSPGGLLLPSFAEQISRKPVTDEIATSNDGRDITRGYINPAWLLNPGDTVLQTRGNNNYQIYEDIARDDQVKTCRQQRELALIGKEWSVEPGDTSRAAKKAADRLKANLDAVLWDDKTQKMLSAVLYGYAVAEILWGSDGSEITIDAIKVRNRARFGFLPSGELRMRTSRDQVLGEALPPGKFWSFSCGADHDDEAYGLGLGHYLYWPVFFKKNGMRAWLTFLDKFAQPTALGKYPVNATADEKLKLLQALAAIQSDSAIRIPEGMEVELLEAARSGTADYTALVDRMNAAISKVYVGHSAAADETPGKLGGQSSSTDVREDLIRADADLICNSFNLSAAKWLTFYNDGEGVKPPRVWRDVTPSEDLKARAETDKTIFDMGYKPTLKYVNDTYDGEYEAAQASGDGAQPNTDVKKAPADVAQFAGQGAAKVDLNQVLDIDPTPGDNSTQQLAELTAGVLNDWLGSIEALVNKAESLEALQADLVNFYGHLDGKELTKVMGLAFAAADLSGRFDVYHEYNNNG